MLSITVSVGLCLEFDEHGDLRQVQEFGELLWNSENLEVEIYNVHNFTAPQPLHKTNIITTSNIIYCTYGILWRLCPRHNVEDCNLEFDEWYNKNSKPYKIQALEN